MVIPQLVEDCFVSSSCASEPDSVKGVDRQSNVFGGHGFHRCSDSSHAGYQQCVAQVTGDRTRTVEVLQSV